MRRHLYRSASGEEDDDDDREQGASSSDTFDETTVQLKKWLTNHPNHPNQ